VTFDAVNEGRRASARLGANQTTFVGVQLPGRARREGRRADDVIAVDTSSFGAGGKLDLGAGVNGLTATASTFGGKLTYSAAPIPTR
jgi:hypothetical protein